METRKVQVTGGNTYTISIPKEWADEHGVTAGDYVRFDEVDDILFMSTSVDPNLSVCTVDTRRTGGGDWLREVTTMYVGGFDRVRLQRDFVGGDHSIDATSERLLGAEVQKESETEVTLRISLDETGFTVESAVERMGRMSVSLLNDAMEALLTNDDQLAHDTIERDNAVDRLNFALSRVNRRVLQVPPRIKHREVSSEELYHAYVAARQLERVADHACKIAELSLNQDGFPADATEALVGLQSRPTTVVGHAVGALLTDDSDETDHHVDAVHSEMQSLENEMATAIDRIDALGPPAPTRCHLVIDSLSRCADYGRNIVEMTLQDAARRP
jgi:phosphate uptake regulator